MTLEGRALLRAMYMPALFDKAVAFSDLEFEEAIDRMIDASENGQNHAAAGNALDEYVMEKHRSKRP